tara:strand:+ start:179 stop:1057 length:879 start_codon:yes stop_codon:yes gene_type:complete
MKRETLNKYSHKIYSQFGEDGILLEMLKRLGKKNQDYWCVEFGARDGISDSNTLNLIKNNAYKAVLIEGEKNYFKKLCKNFPQEEIIKLNKFINFSGDNNLDNILKKTIIPKNFDFLSIDIDGCDYYIFDSLNEYRPKIICIEFNHLIPNAVEFVQKKDFSVKQGCSAKSLIKLGKIKNYEVVASSLTNLFFVDKSYFKLILKDTISLDDLINDDEIKNYIFCGYDGSFHTTKPLRLDWHKIDIKKEKIQPLPSFIRHFPDDYSLLQKLTFLLYREILSPGRFIKKIFSKKK